MLDFLAHLFDTSDFPSRWHCGHWTAGHGWLHILSDLGVWSAYFAIPCILGYFVLQRRDIPFRMIFWLFGAFILACGTTHLMEALIFWWPAYRLAGVIKLLTALVSWGTVAALVPTLPKALVLRTPAELEREVAARKQAEDALQKANSELERRVQERTVELAQANASLRESQRREKERADELEAILRAAPTPIWIAHDPQCHRITGNLASFDLLGLPEGSNVSATSPDHDPGERGFREYRGDEPIPPDELPVQRAARGQLVKREEVKFIFDDGRVRYIYGNAVPLRNPDGSVRGCVAAFADVTPLKEAEQALRRSEAQFRQLADAMPQIVWTTGPDGNIDYLNRRWTEFTGLPQTVSNDAWGQILHPDDARPAGERWGACLRSGSPFDMEIRLLDRREQSYRWHLIRTMPVHDEAGRVVRWFGTGTDIHEQKRAEEAARFLAGASAELAGVVDYERTLQKIANLAVPRFADWSAVDLEENQGLRRLVVAHQDPSRIELAQELTESYPPDPQAKGGIGAVYRTGKPEIMSEVTDELLARGAKDERHLRLMRALGLKSYICVPLIASGDTLGVFTFATAESGRRYTEADLALATDLAHRAAVAVENARLYEALRQSEQRFARFMQHLPGLAWIKDLQGRYVYANDAAMKAFRCTRDGLCGRTDEDVFPPETAAQFKRNDQKALASGTGVQVIETLEQEDGIVHHSVVSKFPIPGPEGGPAFVGGMAIDITDRITAEAASRETAATLRSFYDTAPMMMGVVEVGEDDILHLTDNAATARFFGRSPEALHRQLASRLGVPAETVREWVRHYRESERSGVPVRFEYTYRTPDGTRWLSATVYCIERLAGGRIRCSYVVEDATERKQAEEALRQSEERFRQLAENVNEVFWMTDPQTTELLYISPAYERVWGRSCRSLYENPRSFMDAIHPEDRERVRTAVLENQSRGEQTDKEYRVVRPDGSVRWVRDRAFPVKDAAGRFYRLVGIIDDFTERKKAEEALKEADRRKDEFLATLAHELRNPLAPLRNGLQILRLAGNDRAAAEQARTLMERQLEHFIRLVDDLLDLSRVSRGKIVLHKQRLDLAAVVNAAVESCDPLIRQSGHELTVTLPDEPVYVDADKTRLAQVLCNLLTNAAKFSECGGRIWLTAERQGGDAVVSVKDTGVGIPPDMLAKVFEMFAQVDRSLEKTQGGLGIGLSIVKRLVEMHGGSVEARSGGQGMGSEFLIRLPVVLSVVYGREQGGGGDQQQTRPVGRYRVLVVEDNVDSADSLAMMLTLMGNEVRTAHDGLEGVAAAAAYRPDLILLDIGMPKLNGYDACRRIREQPWGKGILIAAVTGWGQDEDKRRSEEAGFNCHLVKPVGPADVEKLLAELRVGVG
jgi:PAS domain S-box-containing protein